MINKFNGGECMIAAWHRGDKLCDGLAVSSLLKEGGRSAMCLHSWPNLLGWLHSPAGSRVSFSSSFPGAEGPGQCLKGHQLQIIALI